MTLDGSTKLAAAIAKVQKEIDDTAVGGGRMRRDIIRKMGELDGKQNEQAFKTEGTKSAGGDWPALGTKAKDGPPGRYGKWKAKHHKGKKMNVLTGELRKSLRNATHDYRVLMLQGRFLIMGTEDPIAGYVWDGSEFVPARAWEKTLIQKEHLKLQLTTIIAQRVSLVLGTKSFVGKSFRRSIARLQRADPRAA